MRQGSGTRRASRWVIRRINLRLIGLGFIVSTTLPLAGSSGCQGERDASSNMTAESGPLGGAAGALSNLEEVRCDFDIDAELSEAIGTVGIVKWTTTLNNVDRAVVEFGRDEASLTSAPVDLREPSHRTLLLGMVPNEEYLYRIIATAGTTKCTSRTFTLQTGPGPNGTFFPDKVRRSGQGSVAPGFMVTSQFLGGQTAGKGAVAYIMNQDGQLVWWYQTDLSNISRALLSYDGKHLYARNINVGAESMEGRIVKISMDGLSAESFELETSHHDMAATRGNGLAVIMKEPGEDSCDRIVQVSAAGELEKVIYSIRDAYRSGVAPDNQGEDCHCNSIHYSEFDDAFTISDLNKNAYIKVSRQGELIWVLGGEDSDFEGISWERQHGHHMLDERRIFFFNNNSVGENSLGLFVELDLEESKATSRAFPTMNSSITLGDAQVLPNGNYLLTFSNSGLIVELTEGGEVVQEITFRTGGALGYLNHRPTLYGPPPR